MIQSTYQVFEYNEAESFLSIPYNYAVIYS